MEEGTNHFVKQGNKAEACVVCCCKLNNLFGQVSTRAGGNQLTIFRCTNVHMGRHTRLLIYARHLRRRRESE